MGVMFLPAFVTVHLAENIDLFFIIVIVRQGAKDLSWLKVIPISENLLHRHAGSVVVVDDVPNGDASVFDYRRAAAYSVDFDNVRISSLVSCLLVNHSSKELV